MAITEYDPSGESTGRAVVERAFRLLVRPVQAVAFWSATVLPLCSVALLYLDGWTPTTALLFVASAVAIVVGHPHGRYR